MSLTILVTIDFIRTLCKSKSQPSFFLKDLSVIRNHSAITYVNGTINAPIVHSIRTEKLNGQSSREMSVQSSARKRIDILCPHKVANGCECT